MVKTFLHNNTFYAPTLNGVLTNIAIVDYELSWKNPTILIARKGRPFCIVQSSDSDRQAVFTLWSCDVRKLNPLKLTINS